MLLWATLLVLAPASGQVATAPKPVIFLHPPWTPVFQGETVNLTCSGFSFSSPGRIKWYHGHRLLTETEGNTLEVKQLGDYRCWVGSSSVSDPVHLDFVAAALVLQTPLFVFEGDSAVLRCRARAQTELDNIKIYKDGELLALLGKNTEFNIHRASLRDNGEYHCTGVRKNLHYGARSNTVKIQVQELFSSPVLTDSLSQSKDGTQVTLTCKTQLSPQKSDVMLQFCFFRNNKALESGCTNNPELQISAIWPEYSGIYQCKAGAVISSVWKESRVSQIRVQRAVAKVRIPTHSASESVIEGQELLLICLVEMDPRFIKFSWYKKRIWNKDEKIFSEAKYKISIVQSSHEGEYYCKGGQFTSKPVVIKVKVPVSQPVLTLSTGKTKFLEGERVNFRCEVNRGSPEILYQFLHEDAILWKTKTSSSLARFPLTVEHSGNYYCTANNGLGPKRSEALKLSVTVPVSQPVLTLSTGKTKFLEGERVNFCCEVNKGSPEILYQFLRENAILWTIKSSSRLAMVSLTVEHSGNYYCTANNGLGPKRSEALKLSVTVPVSQPVLTLRTAKAETIEGDVVTLHCEAQRGSLPILYRFYHVDVLQELSSVRAGTEASYSFSLTAEHSGNYYCTADNGSGPKRSKTVSLSVTVPVSVPIFTLHAPRVPTVVGDVMELHCEVLKGSPPILFLFYQKDVILKSIESPSKGGASFKFTLTEEHSGNYFCEASNGQKVQRSDTVTINVKVPVSRPVFTLRGSRAQSVEGDMVELHCEVLLGSPPILYQFYRDNVILRNSSAPSGGGASFKFILTKEHSGNYSCEASNGLEAQLSEVKTLKVIVPVSRPVLTLRVPRAQAVVGDEMELHCEALRGSPPILYRFYHENVTLRNDSAFSGKGVSFNLSLTAEHSGNYSCEADNGLGAQQSEVVTLFITGLAKNRRGAVATGVTGALLSMAGLAAGALLFYFWLSRKARDRSASHCSRSPSDSNPQEHTYHNVPGWIELQPVYINVNPRGGDVVYSEVRRNQEENKHAAASRSRILRNEGASVIYSQVKACTLSSGTQQSATWAPHR
ncbi:PREDICTED: Fc receptor-like protein 5 isoform X1 [Chinchilla lanigera]|uniref:Fc receptor-like protein 5 isoform X1 n=1 Tax=Chinchilla lanigera TaxID=34839 RepID=UPI00038ED500|nr:PREDICTED: Fc receptor-like protein 5 isoform X1 [Chinchilla lanigera]